MRHVLFVHGTGVREAEYSATLASIKHGLGPAGQYNVIGCLWGDTHGVRLGKALSVPLYEQSKDITDIETDEVQGWDLLLHEPLLELQIAAETPAAIEDIFSGSASAIDPVIELTKLIGALSEDGRPGCFASLSDKQIEAFIESLMEIRDYPESKRSWDGAMTFAGKGTDGIDFAAHLFARAIVATWLVRLYAAQQPSPTGETRDELVEDLATLLGASKGQAKGIAAGALSMLLKPVKMIGSAAGGLALRAATLASTHYRRTLADAASVRVGDILLYQARGERIRQHIAKAVKAVGEPVILLAHSLGGIACVDLLVKEPDLPVTRLVTVGSQAPFLWEIGALASLEPSAPFPDKFPPWLNFYDKNDLLSFVGQPLLPDIVEDVEIKSGQPFPLSHSAYWSEPIMWSRFHAFVHAQ